MGRRGYGTAAALTARQREFSDRVLSGKSPTLAAAYREVYQPQGQTPKQRKAQSNEASRLWKHPGVRAYCEEARREVEKNRARRALGQRQRIAECLWAEAEGAGKASDRIAALRLLGQQSDVQMFSEKLEVSHGESEISDAEVVAEIENALREALADRESHAIDVTPNAEDVEPDVEAGDQLNICDVESDPEV